MAVTWHGPASTTVTRSTRPSSPKSWGMRILFCVIAANLGSLGRTEGGPGCYWGPPPKARVSNERVLLDDLGHHPGADRATALADSKAEALVHGDRLDQLDRHLHVVARHDHPRALGQVGDAGDVSRAEVEL